MRDEKLRKLIEKYCEENETNMWFIDGFDGSVIGVSHDHRIVYDYRKMVEEFAKDNDCPEDEAEEFIQYNTLRSLNYPLKGANKPVVIELDLETLEMGYSD